MKRAKWWVGLVAVVCLGPWCVSEVRADSTIMDGVEWFYSLNTNRNAIVTRIYTSNACYNLTIPFQLTIPYGASSYKLRVENIGTNAFYLQSSTLAWVSFPSSIRTIEFGAFSGCSNLVEVYIPRSCALEMIGPRAFYGCSALESIALSSSVTDVGTYAFYGCSSLASVTMSNNVKRIGDNAFEGCRGLASFTIPGSVTNVGFGAFRTCSSLTSVTIPAKVRGIGGAPFANCGKLKSIEVAADNTRYESAAGVLFDKGKSNLIQCPGALTGSYEIPNSVTTIGTYAFSGCSGLKTVVIPDGVKNIGAGAFNGCTGFTSIAIPTSVTNIGTDAFRGCSGLTTATLPNGLKGIAAGLFRGCPSLTSITIPDNVTSIGDNAFRSCHYLTSATIPSKVRIIGTYAFYDCTSLTSITIPSSVTNIGYSALAGCSGVKSIEVAAGNTRYESAGGVLFDKGKRNLIQCPGGLTGSYEVPNSVTNIGDHVFNGCNGLVSVKIPASVTSIGSNTFSRCKLAMIWAPAAWKGTSRLSAAGLPSNCMVWYGDGPDANISIAPVTKNFPSAGGGTAIITAGSGTWKAETYTPWITLNATSGEAGYPVAYTVEATTNAEPRTGYIQVNGHLHTVTQDGIGGSISPESGTFEHAGGTGTIEVAVSSGISWQALANASWITVKPGSGTGPGKVTYTVPPLENVETRSGTLTVAGETFSVFQYGLRMKLASDSANQDYLAHDIPVEVVALATTEWTVTPNAEWISVVDPGSGLGSDSVTLSIAENPSWNARTGTVSIGTETFTVTQKGRTALEFSISPASAKVGVEGANGVIAVTATPDLPWSAASQVGWLMLYAQTASGEGNGNAVYSVLPNPTLFGRTGTIVVTPGDSKVGAKTHTVTQAAAESALSLNGYEFEATGESCEVRVSVADIVEWQIENTNDWLTVEGALQRTGPGTVHLEAAVNTTVYPRSGTLTIARKTFKVSQKGRGVEVGYDTKLFGVDGGYETLPVYAYGGVSWTAVSSDPTWITIVQGGSGTGDGTISYIVSPNLVTNTSRTGTITVGDKMVYLTQRGYELSIEPHGSTVAMEGGEGEFAVTTGGANEWTALSTVPWISLGDGSDAGTGSGMVRFLYTENDTGKAREGEIIVAGEVYTLQQQTRELVTITAEAEHGGTVSGGGVYEKGTEVELTATPDSGYVFARWTGAVESEENPLKVEADEPKTLKAVFAPMPVVFESVLSDTNGVALAWNNLAWAGLYRLSRGTTDSLASAELLAEIPNTGNCTYLDATGEAEVEYWYWVEAVGPQDAVTSEPVTGKREKPLGIESIVYENLMGAENPNPETYQEGTEVVFENPGSVAGYSFAGWTPSQITADMRGTQTVVAAWTANRYSIVYDPNGGEGTMEPTACTYDEAATVANNEFVWSTYRFTGWALEAGGRAVFVEGQIVTNLTAEADGVVTLYAAWAPLSVEVPVITPGDGTVFVEDECEVSIACATEGASIYFSTDGTTPRQTDAYLYGGPFTISNTVTVKAFAALEDTKSEYAVATITRRILTLAEALGIPDSEVETGGDAGWKPLVDETATNGLSAGSGVIGARGETWLKTTVAGAGVFQFDWRVDCEKDDTGEATWDHLAVFVDGTEVRRIDGTTEWETVSIELGETESHTILWSYSKDRYDEEGTGVADRAWVAGVVWTPAPPPTDPIPPVSDDSEVAAALAGSADPRLAEKLTTAAAYNEYRDWVTAKGLDRQAVKDSPHAWPSFALGADVLFENEPTIRVSGLSLGIEENWETALDVRVSVKDGENPVIVDAAKVATLFKGSSQPGNWTETSRLPLAVRENGTEGDALRFEIVPGEGAESRAFLRLCE